MIFSFGPSKCDRLDVDVRGYEFAPVGDHWDDNWLTIEIIVQAGGFRGKAGASIITSELTKFLIELRDLFKTLTGTVQFKTIEQQLNLKLTGNGRGHLELRGELLDQAGIGNRLLFTLNLDQTQLADSIRQLEEVARQFPERGAPS